MATPAGAGAAAGAGTALGRRGTTFADGKRSEFFFYLSGTLGAVLRLVIFRPHQVFKIEPACFAPITENRHV